MIKKEKDSPSISKQCDLLAITRSGVYYKPKPESDQNMEILNKIDQQYLITPFYGSRRLCEELQKMGYRVNIKKVKRLMRIVNWRTIYPKKRTTRIDPKAYKFPYLLKNLTINKANQVWEIDITYIPMAKGHMYLFAIIDVYTRYVVSWGLSNDMPAEWCCEIIEQAIQTNGEPEIINSDQGSQFTSDLYVNLLKNKGIAISMDSKGRAIDNIFIERLWRSVKTENVYLYAYENGAKLYNGLKEYFMFYNTQRPHQSLDYKTPLECYQMSVITTAA